MEGKTRFINIIDISQNRPSLRTKRLRPPERVVRISVRPKYLNGVIWLSTWSSLFPTGREVGATGYHSPTRKRQQPLR